MNYEFPTPFQFAKLEASKSTMRIKVGACLAVGKSVTKGHNKSKTHTKFANPQIHTRTSIHAELDCLNKVPTAEGGEIYVYREVDGVPAMSRPCNHCLTFLKSEGIRRIYYTIPHEPYWEMEEL